MRTVTWLAITPLLLVAACARPATATATDALTEWLMTSATAEVVGDAAREQGWLSAAPGEVADLRAVMAAVGVVDVGQLDDALGAERDQVKPLFGALRQRRPGSTRGDLAHWVGVALLTFAKGDPDTALIPTSGLWADDYLRDIGELRAIALRDSLADAARPLVQNAEPPPPDFAFKPRGWNTLFAALDGQTGWPLFASPGARALVGAIEIEQGETLAADDYMLVVQRAGRARVREDYVETVAYLEANHARELDFESTGNLTLRKDQVVTVLAHRDDSSKLWLWLGDGRLAVVNGSCCDAPEAVDTVVWLRLADGAGRGNWTMVPDDEFRPVAWSEYREAQIAAGRWSPPSERPYEYPPMGEFLSNRADRPSIAGARLAVFRAGLAEGEPIFVLHGSPGLGSAYLREPITATIGQARQLLFYDQRGSGYSDGADDPGAFTMRRMVDDLELLRRRADLDQIDLLGHGFGGLVALHYVLVHPQRVRRLVLVEPEPASRAEWEEFVAGVAELSPEDRLRFGQVADEYVTANWEATRDLVRTSLGDWDLHDQLERLQTPTLIVSGTLGGLTAAQRLHQGLGDAELVVLPGVGHYPFIEAPDEFAEAVMRFLRPLKGDEPPSRK